jgi:hypothetical protein
VTRRPEMTSVVMGTAELCAFDFLHELYDELTLCGVI